MNPFHEPVLLKEILEYLKVYPGKKYIDATLGGGGHTLEILKRGGKVLGIDLDEEALDYAKKQVQSSNFQLGKDVVLAQGNFKEIGKIAHLNGFDNVYGILFDLGVSSYQIDTGERGFSFQKDAPLDMRMDKNLAVRAADLVNVLSKGELYELFTKLGEERNARAIVNNIIRARRVKPIETTAELSSVIEEAYGTKKSGSYAKFKALVNKRVFQALRIAVNDELNNLKEVLPQTLELLEKNGRILAISFHSLEDRIIKDAFKEFEEKGMGKVITRKPIVPSLDEITKNTRSRSSKLRIFEKI